MSVLSELLELILKRKGAYGARRLERSADEVPALDHYYPDLLKAEGGRVEEPSYGQQLREAIAAQERLRPGSAALTHATAFGQGRRPAKLNAFGQEVTLPFDTDYFDRYDPETGAYTGQDTGGFEGALQLGYDLKTLPFYFNPVTAIPAALADVGEGLTRGDPFQTALSALGVYGKPFLGLRSAALPGVAGGATGAATFAPEPAEGSVGKNLKELAEKLADPFYSKLERELQASQTKAAPLSQWAGELSNRGVKPEELEWVLGLRQAPGGAWEPSGRASPFQPDAAVTREDLARYLETEGRLLPEETFLSDEEGIPNYDELLEERKKELFELEFEAQFTNQVDDLPDRLPSYDVKELDDGGWGVFRDEELEDDFDTEELANAALRVLIDADTEVAKRELRTEIHNSIDSNALTRQAEEELDEELAEMMGTRYGETAGLVLPGGENYQELLITLPHRGKFTSEHSQRLRQLDMRENLQGNLTPQEEAERNALNARLLADNEVPNFLTNHWDEPNVLAHVRFNDRIDADGKKVLFLEEIQSDWHQQAASARQLKIKELIETGVSEAEATARVPKNYGYQTGKRREIDTSSWRVEHRRDDPPGILSVMESDGNVLGQVPANSREEAIDALLAENDYLANAGDAQRLGDVPNAPLKGTAWPEMALKRMIKYAADNGYDRVAWTTGEQQVDRYSTALKTRVNEIRWEKTPEGIHLVGYKGEDPSAYTIEDEVINTRVKENTLSDALGKAMAQKIVADPAQTGTLKGEDLTISKTGMASFYDRLLPRAAAKLGKKYKATVGTTKIGIGDDEWGVFDRDGNLIETRSSEVAATKKAETRDGYYVERVGGEEVHSLELTPELVKAARTEGFPFFSVAAPAGLEGARQLAGARDSKDDAYLDELLLLEERAKGYAGGGRVIFDELAKRLAKRGRQRADVKRPKFYERDPETGELIESDYARFYGRPTADGRFTEVIGVLPDGREVKTSVLSAPFDAGGESFVQALNSGYSNVPIQQIPLDDAFGPVEDVPSPLASGKMPEERVKTPVKTKAPIELLSELRELVEETSSFKTPFTQNLQRMLKELEAKLAENSTEDFAGGGRVVTSFADKLADLFRRLSGSQETFDPARRRFLGMEETPSQNLPAVVKSTLPELSLVAAPSEAQAPLGALSRLLEERPFSRRQVLKGAAQAARATALSPLTRGFAETLLTPTDPLFSKILNKAGYNEAVNAIERHIRQIAREEPAAGFYGDLTHSSAYQWYEKIVPQRGFWLNRNNPEKTADESRLLNELIQTSGASETDVKQALTDVASYLDDRERLNSSVVSPKQAFLEYFNHDYFPDEDMLFEEELIYPGALSSQQQQSLTAAHFGLNEVVAEETAKDLVSQYITDEFGGFPLVESEMKELRRLRRQGKKRSLTEEEFARFDNLTFREKAYKDLADEVDAEFEE